MKKIPKLKKKVNAFLVGEEGKISKQSLLKAGTILGAISLSSIMALKGVSAETHPDYVTHVNSLSLGYSGGTAAATHTHHASHTSHGSHGSHNSW